MATTDIPPSVTNNLKDERENMHQELQAGAILNDLPFDPVALKQKYLEERNKRLRDDGGVDQYRPIEGSLAHYIEDPYIREELERGPIDEEIEVLVIGGGYGGQLVAVKQLEAGIKSVRIVEKGGDFGGTWYVSHVQILSDCR